MAIVQQNKNMTPGIQVVIFRLHDEEFGVEIAYIREITRMLDITTINEPSGFIRGVVNLRGQVIVVVDLARQFGFGPKEKIPKTDRIIFVELKKRVFGFIVDQIFDVTKVSPGDDGSGQGHIQTAVQADYIKGVGRADEKSIIVLDLEKVFLKFI